MTFILCMFVTADFYHFRLTQGKFTIRLIGTKFKKYIIFRQHMFAVMTIEPLLATPKRGLKTLFFISTFRYSSLITRKSLHVKIVVTG
jgi:hypothetical protein